MDLKSQMIDLSLAQHPQDVQGPVLGTLLISYLDHVLIQIINQVEVILQLVVNLNLVHGRGLYRKTLLDRIQEQVL